MINVTSNAKEWYSSTLKPPSRVVIQEAASVRALIPQVKEDVAKLIGNAEWWEGILHEFMKNVIYPKILERFRAVMNDPSHWPKIVEGSTQGPLSDSSERVKHALDEGRGYNLRESDAAVDISGNRIDDGAGQIKLSPAADRIREGYKDLLKELEHAQVEVANSTAIVGIGPMQKILQLRLNRYMPSSGSKRTNSSLNSLYYAVEFGTGIAANTGGHVRTEGDTKDDSGRYPGSWWLGAKGLGAHFVGQKAAGIFHDPATRLPKFFWKDLIYKEWPKFLHQRLQKESAAFSYY